MKVHVFWKMLGAVILTGLLTNWLLSSCGGSSTPIKDGNAGNYMSELKERRIKLSDGRTLTCVVYDGYQADGLSCDWQLA